MVVTTRADIEAAFRRYVAAAGLQAGDHPEYAFEAWDATFDVVEGPDRIRIGTCRPDDDRTADRRAGRLVGAWLVEIAHGDSRHDDYRENVELALARLLARILHLEAAETRALAVVEGRGARCAEKLEERARQQYYPEGPDWHRLTGIRDACAQMAAELRGTEDVVSVEVATVRAEVERGLGLPASPEPMRTCSYCHRDSSIHACTVQYGAEA